MVLLRVDAYSTHDEPLLWRVEEGSEICGRIVATSGG
jgi:hypothetical protein